MRAWFRGGLMGAMVSLACGVGCAQGADEVYALHHGDTLLISVWREDHLQKEVRVLPDGSVTFPLAGRVSVAGVGVEEVARRLTARLQPYIPEAVVSVLVTGTDGNRVYVLGKVAKPGPVLLQGPETPVLQVIAQAGGLDRFADGNGIQVLRKTPQGPLTLPVRYNDLIRGGDLASNVPLVSGDTVLVP